MLRQTPVRRLALAAATALATAFPALADEVRIGVIANITGTDVQPSLDLVAGAQAAAEDINAAGGIDGAPIKLIVEDSAYRMQEAMNAATKLYSVDGVQSAIMFGGSNLMIPVAEMARDQGRVLINTSSSSPLLGNFPGVLFSVMPLDNIVGKQLGGWIYDRGVRSASFVVPNNAFGTGLMDAISAEFAARGGEVKAKVAYTEGAADYRTEMQSVIQAGAEAIVTAGYGDDSKKWLRLAKQFGVAAPWYAAYPGILSIDDPDWMNGKLFGLDNGGMDEPAAQDVLKRQEAAAGKLPMSHFLYAYDSISLLAEAMKAKGTTAADIAAALPEVVKTYPAKTGQITWDDRNQRIDPPLEFFEFTGGALKKIQ